MAASSVELPPLPPGFELEPPQQQSSSSALPPIPDGFELEAPQQGNAYSDQHGALVNQAINEGVGPAVKSIPQRISDYINDPDNTSHVNSPDGRVLSSSPSGLQALYDQSPEKAAGKSFVQWYATSPTAKNAVMTNPLLGMAPGEGLARPASRGMAAAVPKTVAPVDPATTALANRLQAKATEQGLSLKDVNPSGDTQTVLKNVQTDLSTEIGAHANTLDDYLNPQKATSPEDYEARIQALSAVKAGKTLTKSTASPSQLDTLTSLVGDTDEGQKLINAIKQSNVLTDKYNAGLKGGVSQYTDQLMPVVGGGHGIMNAMNLARSGGLVAGYGVQPHAIAPALAAVGAGRLIDKITGRRFPINKFVQDNAGEVAAPAATTPERVEPSLFPQDNTASSPQGPPSVIAQRNADAEFRRQMQEAGVENSRIDDAFKAQRAAATAENANVDAANTATRQAADYENADKDRAYRSDRTMAEWENVNNDIKAKAAKAGVTLSPQQQSTIAAARMTNDKQASLFRAKGIEDNDPSFDLFHQSVYDRTGLKPQDALNGVKALATKYPDLIPEDTVNTWINNPKKLMSGNIGNRIITLLNREAKNGQLPRDPEWAGPPQAAPSMGGVGGYDPRTIQGNANQAAGAAALDRIAQSSLPDADKGVLMSAGNEMLKTNNQADAAAHMAEALSKVSHPASKGVGSYELGGIYARIRHPDADAAAAARNK